MINLIHSVCCLFSLWTHFCAFSIKIFVILQHCVIQNFSLEIVLINSLGGTAIAYAAFLLFFFKECTHPKPHVLYSVPL